MTEEMETGGSGNGFIFDNASRMPEALLSAVGMEGHIAVKWKGSALTWNRKASGRNFIWSSEQQ